MSTENYCFWSASIRRKAISNWDFCSNTCCLSSVSLPISGSVCISASLTLQENDMLPSALSANSTGSLFAELSGTSSVKSTDETFNLWAALLGGISKFCTIGSFLLHGDVLIHANTQGTTPVLGSFLPARVFLISPGLKCLEYTFVASVTLKYFPSSLLIACSYFLFNWGSSIGNLKNDILFPFSSWQPFFVHSGTQQWVGISFLIIIWYRDQ